MNYGFPWHENIWWGSAVKKAFSLDYRGDTPLLQPIFICGGDKSLVMNVYLLFFNCLEMATEK